MAIKACRLCTGGHAPDVFQRLPKLPIHCLHCRQEECAAASNAAATEKPCESHRCQPGHHEQG